MDSVDGDEEAEEVSRVPESAGGSVAGDDDAGEDKGEEDVTGRSRRKVQRLAPKDLSEQIAKAQQELAEVEASEWPQSHRYCVWWRNRGWGLERHCPTLRADRNASYLDRLKVLEAEREDKCSNADALRDWQIKSAQQLCEYTKFAAV